MRLRYLFLILVFFCVSCKGEDSSFHFERQEISVMRGNEEIGRFTVEIADTEEKRARGLMYRTQMGDEEGMLFLFPQSRHISMWMANTPLSLDMLFIDSGGIIRRIEERTTPYSRQEIRSETLVLEVLEINGGFSAKLGIEIGDKIKK